VEIVVNAADPNLIHRPSYRPCRQDGASHRRPRDRSGALAWFPQEDSPHPIWFRKRAGLKQLKRGYVAKYKQGQAFIVLEDSPQSAAAVLKELRAGTTAPPTQR